MTNTMAQCRMHKGAFSQVAFIPTRFAILNAVVKLRGVDGWRIIGIGCTRRATDVNHASQEYKRHRHQTDV